MEADLLVVCLASQFLNARSDCIAHNEASLLELH